MTNSALQQAFDTFIFAVEEDLPRHIAILVAKELGVDFESENYDLP